MAEVVAPPPGDAPFPRSRILIAVAVWLVLGVLAWQVRPETRFLNVALTGSLVLTLAEPGLDRLRRTLLLGTGFGLLWTLAHAGSAVTLALNPSLPGAFLGLGALQEMALHPPENSTIARAAFGLPAFALLPALHLFPALPGPGTQDAVLLEADRALGGLFSYAVATVLEARPALATFAWLAYVTLPLEVALVLLVAIRSDLPGMRPGRIMLACLATGLLGAALYRVCPAAGPMYAFSNFPYERPAPQPLAAIIVPSQFPRNAIPSLHFAWAWILQRAAQPVPWLRWTTLAWLAGTGIATLGYGEHYLIDLIVAFPFVATMEALVANARWPRLLLGTSVTLTWLIYLGADGRLVRPLAWAAVAATFAAALWVAPRRPYAAPRTGEDAA